VAFKVVRNTQVNKWLPLCMTQTIHAKHFHLSAPLELSGYKIPTHLQGLACD